MGGDAVLETRFDKRGDTIRTPKRVLEGMGLPSERDAIRDADVYLHVEVFGEDGEHLGTRRKRLLPSRSNYWPVNGEPLLPQLHAGPGAPQAGNVGKPGRGPGGPETPWLGRRAGATNCLSRPSPDRYRAGVG